MLHGNSIKASKNKLISADLFCQKFAIPREFQHLLPVFFTPEEQAFVLQCSRDIFSREDYPADFLRQEYHRGLLVKAEGQGHYRLSDFYSLLDVFAVSRQEEYGRLPWADRQRLDRWYFRKYLEGLSPSQSRPTDDQVLPLEEVLSFIDAQQRPAYLNYCDCRSLTGACGLPTHTCITYRSGSNSFVDRGLSQPLDKEAAKEIVRQADAAGLMHTLNPNGICNCCGDCCYLFRAQRQRQSLGTWPASPRIAVLDKNKCLNCGRCIRRCHQAAFSRRDAGLCFDEKRCVGCGLCVNTCPAGALALTDRKTTS